MVFDQTPAFGQTTTPKFDVASIKPSQPGRPYDVIEILKGGTFRGTHVTAHTMIRFAYDVFSYQINAGPGWLESDTYDVMAKPDGDVNREQVKLMVRALLADRFKLAFHRDPKEVTGYEIVVAKKGPKLHAADPDSRARKEIGRRPKSYVDGKNINLDSLATSLAVLLGCPVADKTALDGKFDFRLEWTPDGAPVTDEPGASIFTAMEDQLGLKLEARKVTVEALEIDHIEKPSGN